VVLVLTLLLMMAQSAPPTTADGWAVAGFQALRTGAAEEASAAFAQAIRLDGSNALAMLGAGVSANMRGRTDEARQHLAGALRLQPSLTAAALLLGEIQYQSDDLRGAIETYEQALARARGSAAHRAPRGLAARSRRPRHVFQQTCQPLPIMFDGPPDQPSAGACRRCSRPSTGRSAARSARTRPTFSR
jgi:tetratricopeptide (TPR) repeat protein